MTLNACIGDLAPTQVHACRQDRLRGAIPSCEGPCNLRSQDLGLPVVGRDGSRSSAYRQRQAEVGIALQSRETLTFYADLDDNPTYDGMAI
jgi:hypothetical protein